MDDPSARRTAGSVQIPRDARTRTPELRSASTFELAIEMLDRFRAGESMSSSNMLAKTLAEIGLRAEIELDNHVNRYSTVRTAHLCNVIRRHPDFRPGWPNGKTVVEFGCGGINPLGGLMVLLMAGAQRIIGVDLESVVAPDLAVRAMYRSACDMLAVPERTVGKGYPLTVSEIAESLRGFDLWKMSRGDIAGIDEERVQFLQRSAAETQLESASVDAILSSSFLEHVPDPGAIAAEMARILVPGGLASHRVDGADHRRYGSNIHALQFLVENSSEPLVFECNRIRPLDLERVFESSGLEVVAKTVFESVDVPEDLHRRMVEPFRSMSPEHIGAVGVEFHLRKLA